MHAGDGSQRKEASQHACRGWLSGGGIHHIMHAWTSRGSEACITAQHSTAQLAQQLFRTHPGDEAGVLQGNVARRGSNWLPPCVVLGVWYRCWSIAVATCAGGASVGKGGRRSEQRICSRLRGSFRQRNHRQLRPYGSSEENNKRPRNGLKRASAGLARAYAIPATEA